MDKSKQSNRLKQSGPSMLLLIFTFIHLLLAHLLQDYN